MPIYEFYCADCHRVYSFLSRTVNTEKVPSCPRCGKPELVRRTSLFAVSRGRQEPTSASPEQPPPADQARLEKLMESLGSEAEGLDENDPRQAVGLMRRVFEATGMPFDRRVEEAFRRMEAGEDAEKIEEEMGDVFDSLESSLGDGAAGGPAEPRKGLSDLRRRLPPSFDSTLYEM